MRPPTPLAAVPERSTATLRGFRRHLDRAALAGSLVAIGIAVGVTLLGSLEGWPALSRVTPGSA